MSERKYEVHVPKPGTTGCGRFRFIGHKMFCSLAPVWTRYGLHGLWADADGGPTIVHAFLPRSADGYRIIETWDTMGMRPTRSDDVLLDGPFRS